MRPSMLSYRRHSGDDSHCESQPCLHGSLFPQELKFPGHSFIQVCHYPHLKLFFLNSLFINSSIPKTSPLEDEFTFNKRQLGGHLYTLHPSQPHISYFHYSLNPPPIWLSRREAHLQCPLWQFFSTSQRPVVELGSTTENHLPTVITR